MDKTTTGFYPFLFQTTGAPRFTSARRDVSYVFILHWYVLRLL